MLTCNYDGRQGVGNLVNQKYVILQKPGTEIGKADEVPRVKFYSPSGANLETECLLKICTPLASL